MKSTSHLMKTNNASSPLVLSVISTEGGSGKTTTTINLAWQAYCLKGWKVLIVDLDCNRSLDHFLGTQCPEGRPQEETSWCLFQDGFSGDLPLISVFDSDGQVSLLPCHGVVQPDLISSRIARERILKNNLPSISSYQDYDLIILDNRGGIDTITYNSIAASTHLLIGTKLGPKTETLTTAISELIANCNKLGLLPGPELMGIYFSEVDPYSTAMQIIKESADKALSIYEGLKRYKDIPFSRYITQAAARKLPLGKVRPSFKVNQIYAEMINDLEGAI